MVAASTASLTNDKTSIVDENGSVLVNMKDLQSSDDLGFHFSSPLAAANPAAERAAISDSSLKMVIPKTPSRTTDRGMFSQNILHSSPLMVKNCPSSSSASSDDDEPALLRDDVEYSNPRLPADNSIPPASQLSQEFSQIIWSSSPVSHQTETLLSRVMANSKTKDSDLIGSTKEESEFSLYDPDEQRQRPSILTDSRHAQIINREVNVDKVTSKPKTLIDTSAICKAEGHNIGKPQNAIYKESSKLSATIPVSAKTTSSSLSLSSSSVTAAISTDTANEKVTRKLPWNTTPTTTKQSRLNLRKLNVQKRDMSTYGCDEKDNNSHAKSSSSLRQVTAKGTLAKIFLSREQRAVLDMVVNEGKNVFFTGAAGTGKSVLLRRIIEDLRKRYGGDKVAVTASTGLAACSIGGITLHSFAGIGLGKEDVETFVKKLKRDRKRLRRWRSTKALVVDEISMVDGELFSKLDELAKILRNNHDMPFGGIQLVLTGDFFQLPPVVSQGKELQFTFESESWNQVIEATIVLVQVFRQKDNRFSTILNEMRRGQMSNDTIKIFKGLLRKPTVPDGIVPTELYPRRFEVDRANVSHLNALPSETITYDADDSYSSEEVKHFVNLSNMMAVDKLCIKKGAQVMMIKNMDETLVNGSVGIVMGFMSESTFKMAEMEGMDMSSQELTDLLSSQLDENSKTSTRECPDKGNDLDDVFGIPDHEGEIIEENEFGWKRKRARLQVLKHNAENIGQKWPYVRFYINDGTTRDVLVQPESWSIEDHEGKVLASRSQVPLILAWALSIHKAQGQTLEWLKVDLAKTFEKGQAYVAISRAVSLDGLQVLNFNRSRVMVHQKVVDFYDSLEVLSTTDSNIEQQQQQQQQQQQKQSVVTLDYSSDSEHDIKDFTLNTRHNSNNFSTEPEFKGSLQQQAKKEDEFHVSQYFTNNAYDNAISPLDEENKTVKVFGDIDQLHAEYYNTDESRKNRMTT